MALTRTVLCAVLVLSVNCTPSGESRPERAPRAVVREHSGGTVVFGVLGSPVTVDPYGRDASDLTRVLARPVWPSLFRFTADGAVEPYLAASMKKSDEGVEVRLREAAWNDGTPITARDVVSSARRAQPPSGFAGLRVRAAGPQLVVLEGDERRWKQRLARLTFVLPRGRVRFAPAASGGPFVLASVTNGLGLELVRNEDYWTGSPALLERVRVRYVETLDLLLALLEEGRLDAAWLPYSVNLETRLDELGLKHRQSLGWELVQLDFSGLTASERRALVGAIDRAGLERFFVRRGGRLSETLYPEPGRGGAEGPFGRVRGPSSAPQETVTIAAPVGDELLSLVRRAIFEQLERAGIDAETLEAPPSALYRERFSRAELTLRRSLRAPGLEDRPGAAARLKSLPLFQVRSLVAFHGVRGIDIDATIEGPLAGAQNWFLPDR